MRESGVWTYGVVNLAHILGLSALSGAVLVLDLRLMGCWARIPLASLSEPTVRVAGVGLGVAALTGVCLLATKATDYAGNPFLWWIKFPAIALGLVNIALLQRSTAWKQHRIRELAATEQARLKWFGGASLLCWLVAITAGRMTAYW